MEIQWAATSCAPPRSRISDRSTRTPIKVVRLATAGMRKRRGATISARETPRRTIMKHLKSTSFVAGRSGRADRGTFMGTVRLLLPYIWPADRADLRLRVLLAIVLLVAS